MASVKIPAWPKGVAGNVWANELADQSLYAIESDLLSFSAAAATVAFSIPEDTVLFSVGIEIVTAFTGLGGASRLSVGDTSASELISFGSGDLDTTGFKLLPVLKRYTKAAGVPGRQAKPLQVTAPSAATAGAYRLWIQIKPNRNSAVATRRAN